MPLDDSFKLTQLSIDFVDGARSRARLYVDPDDVLGRGLDVTFLNVEQVVDMADATVALWWQHDQAPALRGLEPFEPVDAGVGHFKLHYPSAMGQSGGTISSKVMVQEGDATIAVPLPQIEVMGVRADPSATPSEDTFSVLAKLLELLEDGIVDVEDATRRANAAADRVDAVVEDAQTYVDDLKGRVDEGDFDGATFTPAVDDDGELTWTNDKGRDNPQPVNIRGPQGERGEDGAGLQVLDSYATYEELTEAHPEGGYPGEAYVVGNHYYTWDGSEWTDCGELKGVPGDPAGWGEVTASVDDTTGDPSVEVTASGPNSARNMDFAFSGIVGPQGERGDDGVSVTHKWEGTTLEVTSASGTSSADLLGPQGDPGTSVTHEWDGTTLKVTSASGTSSADLRGEPGPKGDQGEGLNILDYYDSYETMHAAHPSGDRVGDAYMCGLHYYIWNGSEWRDCGELRGDKGEPGAAAGFGEPTAEIGESTGEPTVSVTATGDDTAKVFNFSFDGIKGEDGIGIKATSQSTIENVSSAFDEMIGTTITDSGSFWASLRPGDLFITPIKVRDQGDAPGFLVSKYTDHQGFTVNGTVVSVVYGKMGPQGFEGDEGPRGPEGPKGDPGDPLEPDQKESLLKEFLLAAHPVGSYYWSDQPTSPETLFGGTWSPVKNRFVWALGDDDTVGNVGGSKTVTLTESQMPSHTHSGPSHSHSLNSHTHSVDSHTHGLNSHTHSLNSHTHTMSHSHSMTHSHTVSIAAGVEGFSTTGSTYKGRILTTGSTTSTSSYTGSTGTYTGSTGSSTGSTGAASGSTASGGSGTTGSASGSTGTGGTGSTGSAGSGTAHENMPPYVCAYCWKRTQ